MYYLHAVVGGVVGVCKYGGVPKGNRDSLHPRSPRNLAIAPARGVKRTSVARRSTAVGLDELRWYPDEVRMAGRVDSDVEWVIEVEFDTTVIVVADEYYRPSDDRFDCTLVFLRQSVQQAGRNGDEDYAFTGLQSLALHHSAGFYFGFGART